MKSSRKKKHLIFNLDERRYAVPLTRVREVIGLTEITPLPKVPRYYLGLINLRGQIISVVDLRLKFGLSQATPNPKKTSIVISQVGAILLGSVVDEVSEVIGYE